MSRTARVEELSDSDPDEMDIEELSDSDEDQLPSTQVLQQRRNVPASTSSQQQKLSEQLFPNGFQQQHIDSLMPNSNANTNANTNASIAENRERSKHWQCLYPVYFDASRSRDEGRRVAKSLAVQNPLARDIADAVSQLGIPVVFEPGRTHPRDWANPGRCRVQLSDKDGKKTVRNGIENKHHLFIKVAQYLRQHPTDESSPLRLRIPGMQPVSKPLPPPAVPRGWKIGTILPLHSAAVTGGGVSENLFKDMMAEMGGQLPPGMEGMAALAGVGGGGGAGASAGGAAGKAKKEKKKIKG